VSVPITLADVLQALALSGADGFDADAARRHMSVQPRPLAPPPGTVARQSAVLLLIYPHHDSRALHFPLMRRPDTRGVHSGQISLPGGSQEPGETTTETALREAEEEMGIRRADVTVIGALSPIYVPPSNFEIHPIVGTVSVAPAWLPNPAEVAELIEAPIAVLLDDSIKSARMLEREGHSFGVRIYTIAGHEVWGATAAILGEFELRLRAATTGLAR